MLDILFAKDPISITVLVHKNGWTGNYCDFFNLPFDTWSGCFRTNKTVIDEDSNGDEVHLIPQLFVHYVDYLLGVL